MVCLGICHLFPNFSLLGPSGAGLPTPSDRRRLIVLEGLPAAAGHGQSGHGQLSHLRPEERTDLLVGLLCAMGPWGHGDL